MSNKYNDNAGAHSAGTNYKSFNKPGYKPATCEKEVLLSLNDRLMKKALLKLDLKPFDYQKELYKKALDQNVIIYLGTGLGKTFITVLFLKSPQIDALIHDGRKVVFLAPTQDLIKQQAEYVNRQVSYKVKIYCGRSSYCGQHIDHWSKPIWTQELEKIDVLFMTPQIFACAISNNLLNWEKFSAVIFDEVHHAQRKNTSKESQSPYMQIITSHRQYYQTRTDESLYPKPRLIGLTASLINKMPKNRADIADDVRYLEKILSAKCCTDFKVQESKPKMIIHSFPNDSADECDILLNIFSELKDKMEEALKTQKAHKILKRCYKLSKEDEKTLAFQNRLRLAAVGFSIKPGSFPKVIEGLKIIRKRCGLWALRAVCHMLLVALQKHSVSSCLQADIKPIYADFTAILSLVHCALDNFLLSSSPREELLTYTSAKLKALMDILKYEYDRTNDSSNNKSTFSCIVFVRSRLEVVALCQWIKKLSATVQEYSFIRCDYAIGLAATMASKYSCITKRKPADQHKMLANFREGQLNVIVTTSVLEEGIDLPVCSTVIRYDCANNFREYVQSRGRARQNISTFVAMSEFQKESDTQITLNKFNDFEYAIRDCLQGSLPPTPRRDPSKPHEERTDLDTLDYFTAKDGAVRIGGSTARIILNMYCNKLSQRTPFTGGIRFKREQPTVKTYITTLYLPTGCMLVDGIVGREKSCEDLADNSAFTAAIAALYEAGELDENGVPIRPTAETVDEMLLKFGLKPDFEPLEKELEGIVQVIGEKEVNLFEPKLARPDNYLAKNYLNRSYKLIRLIFLPAAEARIETRGFFERSAYGMIVDSTMTTDFIPKMLYSHYGQINVNYSVISDNLLIRSWDEHRSFRDYTHKLLHRCLSIRGISGEALRNSTLFYVVPLDTSNNINRNKMRYSFDAARQGIRVNHIVKLRQFYQQRQSSDSLFIVRAIRRDMTGHSLIPGQRISFFDRCRENGTSIGDPNQSVIEVMPLSKKMAQIKLGKVSKRDEYSTQSCFFLEQLLEPFEEDASCVFQAFNLPEILYDLILMTNASNLDRKFYNETSARRCELISKKPASSPMSIVDDSQENDNREIHTDEPMDHSNIDSDGEADDGDGELSGDEVSDEELTESETDYSDEDDDDFKIGCEYKDMIANDTVNFNDAGDDRENMKRWRMSEYEEKDLKELTFEKNSSTSTIGRIELNSVPFLNLMNQIRPLQQKLIDKLRAIETLITGDASYLDEDAEFKKRTAMVDRGIEPAIKFDRNAKPLREASRYQSIREALTVKRSQAAYNLEMLENIGDSYLKYLVSVVLYKSLDGNEGFLTSARSRLTSNKYFTHLAKKNSLGCYAITQPFTIDLLAYALGREPRKKTDVYNRLREKDLADLVESIVGSYLVYHGEFEAILAAEWLGLKLFNQHGIFDEFHEKAVVFSRVPTALEKCDSDAFKNHYLCYKKKFRRFEDILSYKFQDKSFLIQAFTHPSCVTKVTRSYERLEFLGDAILDMLVTMSLVHSGRFTTPGQISSSRSAVVNNCAFARLAMLYKYDLFIQHFDHQLYDELTNVRLALEEDPEINFLDMVDFDKIVKLLGDVFESVAAAIYLDSGCSLDTVWSVYYPMLKKSIDDEIANPTKNITVCLFETFPGSNRISFEENKISTIGEGKCAVNCIIADVGTFTGIGFSKKQAKKRAIEEAMNNLPTEARLTELNKGYLRRPERPGPRPNYRQRKPYTRPNNRY